MTSAKQPPGGHKFPQLLASQQGQANQREPATFGLSSPWSFPSPSGIPLFAVGQPFLFLQRSICHEMFRPLFCRSAPFHLVLGCSRQVAGVDAESSEVVLETHHPIFFLAPHTARALQHFSEHHALRQCRILRASQKSRKQDPSSA